MRFVPLALTVLLFSSPSRADELRSTLAQPLREVSHTVDVTVVAGVATYKVQRVFSNPGRTADEAGLAIDLPFGAVATGLRIKANEQWYEADLLERGRAAALYQELTGHGPYAPKDPALLQWLWADKLYLQIFPVLPGRSATVEYTLTVPTRYQRGRVWLSYPRAGLQRAEPSAEDARPLVAPVVTVRPAWGDAHMKVVIDGKATQVGAPVRLVLPPRPRWLDAVGNLATSGYVISRVTVPASEATSRVFAEATVELAIAHTYRSDLRVDLITPRGKRVAVHAGEGGGTNDVNGRFEVKLPAGEAGAGKWRLVVSDHAALDVGSLDAWSLQLGPTKAAQRFAAKDLPLFIPDAPESDSEAGLAAIELPPPPIDVVALRLGKVVASAAHAFLRLELDVAPELAPLPRQAKVVFVLDASHSLGAEGIAAQLAIVRAYLAHVPDARVEIVIYRRHAARLFGKLVPATEVPKRLKAAHVKGLLAPGNGSALELGAALAVEALAGQTGALRVVLLTDELLRSTLSPSLVLDALAKLPEDAIVHVVEPDVDETGADDLVRNDAADLAPVAAAHHGIFARVIAGSQVHKALVERVLGLVRPLRIDHLAITGKGLGDVGDRDTLFEGSGARWVVESEAVPGHVTLTGMIWGDPIRREVTVDENFSRAAAGWIFSEDRYGALSEAEQMIVALLAHAVSPVTSLLAIEPGTRPSTIGLPQGGRIRTGHYGVGSGTGGMMGHAAPDLAALLAPALARCREAQHPPAGWSVTLDVETTLDEIVDVAVPKGDPTGMADCLVEAAWALRLGADFASSNDRFVLTLR